MTHKQILKTIHEIAYEYGLEPWEITSAWVRNGILYFQSSYYAQCGSAELLPADYAGTQGCRVWLSDGDFISAPDGDYISEPASREAYCASKYGCVWTGLVEEMSKTYSYAHDTKFFASIEEADAYAEALRESLQECH